MNHIYFSPPYLDGRERELILQAYGSNWITTFGPYVYIFQKEMCEKIGVGHASPLQIAERSKSGIPFTRAWDGWRIERDWKSKPFGV